MSSTIEEYKTNGLTLINTAQRYINIDSIQDEITSIGKYRLIFSIEFLNILFR